MSVVLPRLRIEFLSEEEDESEETGLVAAVPLDACLDKTLGRVTFAGDCIAFDWRSCDRAAGGATGNQDASLLIGFFIHDSVLWFELTLLLRTDSPLLALNAVASNLTLL